MFEFKHLSECSQYYEVESEINHLKTAVHEVDFKDLSKLDFVPFPVRATTHSAGYDLSLPYSTEIKSGESKILFFGLALAITEKGFSDRNHCGLLAARSSLYKNKGLVLKDNYRLFHDKELLYAEFKNITDSVVIIEHGEKLAQLVFTDFPLRPLIFNTKNIENVNRLKLDDFNPGELDEDIFYFQNPIPTTLQSKSLLCLFTGIKWNFDSDKFVLLQRSEKMNDCVIMSNGVGIIDSDYYNNPTNEGEFGFLLLNIGSLPITIDKYSVLGNGTLLNYYTVDGDLTDGERIGGFGSTDSKEHSNSVITTF